MHARHMHGSREARAHSVHERPVVLFSPCCSAAQEMCAFGPRPANVTCNGTIRGCSVVLLHTTSNSIGHNENKPWPETVPKCIETASKRLECTNAGPIYARHCPGISFHGGTTCLYGMIFQCAAHHLQECRKPAGLASASRERTHI
jgi:hypothetical protein